MQITYKIENLINELTETVKSEKAGIAIFITDKEKLCGNISCDTADLLAFMTLALKTIEKETGLKERRILRAVKAGKDILGDESRE